MIAAQQPAAPAQSRRPLLITADPLLLDDLLRLVEVGGAEAEVVADAFAARLSWRDATVVVVGGDVAEKAAALVVSGALGRRAGVIVVAVDLDDAQVWRRASNLGAEHVVFLPEGAPWLAERIRALSTAALQGTTIVGVVGGCGGAGATVFAAALALAGLRRGLGTMLVDADPLGGGIQLVLGDGADTGRGVRCPPRGSSGVLAPVPTLARNALLPSAGELTVLSWDNVSHLSVPATAMAALLAAAQSSELVVVDLPRTVDEAGRVALSAATITYLVVPAQRRACGAAARLLAELVPACVDLRLIVRGPPPAGLSAPLVATSLGLPLAGTLRAEPRLAADLERGEPPGQQPGPLARLCDRLVGNIASAREATRR